MQCQCDKSGFVERDPDDDNDSAADQTEDEAESLELHTKVFNGWRISYTKDNTQKAAKRRRHLHKGFLAQQVLSKKLPEGARHRAPAELQQAAQAKLERGRKRARQTRAWSMAKCAKPEEPSVPGAALKLPDPVPVQAGGSSGSGLHG